MPEDAATPNSARITITFTTTDEAPFSSSDASRGFWDYVQRHIRNGGFENENIRAVEQRVVQRFGRHLRDLLLTDFRTGGDSRYRRRNFPVEFYVERQPISAPSFAFQVAGFRYGSMTLDVDVAGLKGMAEFFDKNIELLQVVLCQYAPAALAMAAGGNGNGGDTWIDGLDCKIQTGPQFAATFNSDTNATTQPMAIPGSPASKTLQSINWAWIVSNTSLVLPVLLSLVVFYFAFVGLDHERERLAQGMTSLADKQTEVLKVLATTIQQKAAEPPKQPSSAVAKAGETTGH
ncbi:MAG TPA: hypothetical protein VN736_03505 [Candidatus Limnocylindrales bacterium]|nr:hypothetical protein [Candidatus Limnocylindrales bacterium]